MWVYIYFQLYIFTTNIFLVISSKHENRQRKDKDPTLFTDVIKNISRVNNALQELIQNYEHLQKIYKAETLEVDISTDLEIDETFRARNQKFTNEDVPVTTKSNLFATQMILSGEKEYEANADKVGEDKTEEKNESEVNNRVTQKMQKIKRKHKTESISKMSRYVHNKNKSLKKNDKSNKIREMNEATVSTTKKRIHKKIEKWYHARADKQSATDVLNSYNDNELKNKNNKTYPKRILEENIETTESLKTTPSLNNSRKVERVLRVESFDGPNLWTDIANKKPVQLKSDRSKTALVILTDKLGNADKILTEEESSSDEIDLKKELEQADNLRTAYGSACMNLVIRKCFKACKNVRKMVCRNYKCKSSFKETFLDTAKTECINEFQNTTSDSDDISRLRRPGNTSFLDATRYGFNLEACYPFLKSKVSAKKKMEGNIVNPSNKMSQVNILRDRFERACQKESSRKCRQACNTSYKEACDTYNCEKGKKKLFKRNCKKECKQIYSGRNSKKSSGSSGSESTSDTDSYSDSEDNNSEDSSN